MRNQLKTDALLALLSGLLIALSYWLIGGIGGMLVGIVIAAVTNLLSWYQSDKIALTAYQAQLVSSTEAPGLYQMVQQLCDRASLPTPAIYIAPSQAANAFATGRDPEHAAVCVTDASSARPTRTPRALASALQKLEASAKQLPTMGNPAFELILITNAFSGKFLSRLFSSHLSTEARDLQLLKLEQELPKVPFQSLSR